MRWIQLQLMKGRQLIVFGSTMRYFLSLSERHKPKSSVCGLAKPNQHPYSQLDHSGLILTLVYDLLFLLDSEVLSSRWFDIWTSECYRVFKLFNRKLAIMYDGRAEARTREQEYWNGLIYWKRKGENWDEDMKMNLEFKKTKMEWWR